MSQPLKPCPFCPKGLQESPSGVMFHNSGGCFVHGSSFRLGSEMHQQWQTRAPSPAPSADLEELETRIAGWEESTECELPNQKMVMEACEIIRKLYSLARLAALPQPTLTERNDD